MRPGTPSVAVVGAGLSGLTAAEELSSRGAIVTVFEKSLGAGGRLATRRSRHGPEFDHGAQLLRAKTGEFAAYLDRACAAGAAGAWTPSPEDPPSLVGIPGMREVVAPLASTLSVQFGTRVTALAPAASGIDVTIEGTGTSVETHDAVLVTAPAPQTAALVSQLAPVDALAGVDMAPCWSLMIALGTPSPVVTDTFQATTGTIEPPLAWLARNSAKPARPSTPECWVAQADAAYSDARLEADPSEVAAELAAEVLPCLERAGADLTYCRAHRWRYALTRVPLEAPFFSCPGMPVWAAGDWCLGHRADHAYRSGRAVALEIAAALGLAAAPGASDTTAGSVA